MGNHDAGRAMGVAAEVALSLKSEFTKTSTLKLLDIMCKPWKGCDAEFEAEDPKKPGNVHPKYTFYTDPHGPLGKLISVAFGKKDVDYVRQFDKSERGQAAWYDGPYSAFRKRYKFC